MSVRGLQQVGQPVRDLSRAVAFYRDVLEVALIADLGHVAFFDLGGITLFMEAPDGETPAGGGVLYLAVDDVSEVQARLADAGVTFTGEPHLIHTDETGTFGPAGGEHWMTFFTDSEDNTLALYEVREK
ncbi:MAG: VOC family protein [Acidimicrobiales bacterium]|jgi:predicted enzyme related to lactoylglutathione lyase|nr:VOC family protein [Acidimicrobiales bacterium]